MSIIEKNIHIHLENKREAFDAMRAYHQSEIEHKYHTVEILRSILSASIFVYGGLFGLLLKDNINIDLVQFAGLATVAINSFIAFSIVRITNIKIREDNLQYCLHYFEYRKERELLGLEQDLLDNGFESKAYAVNMKNEKNEKTHTKNLSICEILSGTKDGKKSGHSHTQNILNRFALMITVVCTLGTIGLYILSVNS